VPPFLGYQPATSWVHYTTSCNTQSSAPEDGWVQRPKHVELIGINKPLLLHLVGVYIIYNLQQICVTCLFIRYIFSSAFSNFTARRFDTHG